MKIIKILSKKVGEKSYYKYILNLPKEVVEKSNLEGEKLKAEAGKDKIILISEKN